MLQQLTRKTRALARIEQQAWLQEIYSLEPKQTEQLIDLAFMQPPDVHDWRLYSALKRIMSQFVGWDADKPEIRTSAHYNAMIEFIQFLLPENTEGMSDPIGFPEEERQERGVHQVDFVAYLQDHRNAS